MRRPSFRMALSLAALAGGAVVVSKVLRGRSASLPVAPAPSSTWPPLSDAATSPVPSTPAPAGTSPAAAGLDDVLTTSSTGDTELAAPSVDEPVGPDLADQPREATGTGEATSSPVAEVVTLQASTADDAPSDATASVAGTTQGSVSGTGASPGRSWTFGGEGDTDSDRSPGSPLGADDPTLDPEPEAVIPTGRIDAAREDNPLIAHGDGPDVPPAPEPTFGTAPDPEAAATAPVHVATPVEVDPDEPLPIPHRPHHDEPGSTS